MLRIPRVPKKRPAREVETCAVCDLPAGFSPLRVMVPVDGYPITAERSICRNCQPFLGPLHSLETLSEIRAKRPKPLPEYP